MKKILQFLPIFLLLYSCSSKENPYSYPNSQSSFPQNAQRGFSQNQQPQENQRRENQIQFSNNQNSYPNQKAQNQLPQATLPGQINQPPQMHNSPPIDSTIIMPNKRIVSPPVTNPILALNNLPLDYYNQFYPYPTLQKAAIQQQPVMMYAPVSMPLQRPNPNQTMKQMYNQDFITNAGNVVEEPEKKFPEISQYQRKKEESQAIEKSKNKFGLLEDDYFSANYNKDLNSTKLSQYYPTNPSFLSTEDSGKSILESLIVTDPIKSGFAN